MTAVLSRQSIVGLAKESTPGTYVAPTAFMPVEGSVSSELLIAALRDESYRANDTVLQGQYPGPSEAKYDFTIQAYPIELGHLFRAIIGPDSVSAAPAATTLSAPITAGSTAISLTVAGTPGQVVVINDANPETRYLVTPTTVNAPWVYAHSNGAAASYLTKHTFSQPSFPQPQPPSYSITDYDGVQTLGFTSARLANLDLTVDAKGMIQAKTQWKANPPTTQSLPTPTYTTQQPMLGWQFANYPTSLAAAGQLTRYTMVDFSLSREVDVIHSGDGTQGPRELFAAGLDVKGKASAIYDVTSDFTTFQSWAQAQQLNTLITSPAGSGAALVISVGQPSTSKFLVNRSAKYAVGDLNFDGVYNASNAGAIAVSLFNTQATTY